MMQRRTPRLNAGSLIAAGLAVGAFAAPAWSFCGFFAGVSDAGMENSGTQTVVARDGRSTTLTLSFNYRGEASDFSVIFPVPVVLGEEDVRVVDRGLIERLDTFTAPRAVRFPSGFPGCPVCRNALEDGPAEVEVTPVTIEAQFVAGEYEILILSAGESQGLFDWLNDQGYRLPVRAIPVLQRYIDDGMFFLAARVTLAAQVRDDFAFLSPLQMSFESEMFGLPILMGTINAAGEQDLLIYTLTSGAQVEVANYPTVHLDLSAEYVPSDWDSFNAFVDAQFEATRQQSPSPAVIVEYVGPTNKGDPPTTDPITRDELALLGYRGEETPHVTRLHMRYSPDEVDEDLLFSVSVPEFFTPNFTRVPLRGDADDDGDVDLADYLALRACVGPPGRAPGFACFAFDLDLDGDVDLSDVVTFQTFVTGSR